MTVTKVPPLRIAIVGGGIGGLCSAIPIVEAIERGANVTLAIYESGATFSELGAGLSFGCNAIACLKLMGLEKEFEKAAGPEGEFAKLWYELIVGEQGHPYTNKVFGKVSGNERIEAVHRADFLDLLVARIPTGISHFNHRCTDYTVHDTGVTINFKARDGTILPSAECDVLVGADGIKSVIRRTLLSRSGKDPSSGDAVYQNWTVYRGMIPVEDFRRACPGVNTKTTFFGTGMHIVVFPVRGGELINFVGYVWDEECKRLVGHSGPWGPDYVPIEEALEDYRLWSPQCLELLKVIKNPSRWGVFAVPPIETPIDTRVVIIGDAAHGTTPHRGAGAGMSVEDAYFISAILTDPYVTNSSPQTRALKIQHALSCYSEIRHARGLRNVVGSKEAGRILEFSGFHGEGTDTEKITRSLQANLDEVWKYEPKKELERALKMVRSGP
ncbi:salicylate hydroxylase [Pseudohyphozyma bogoriensis]|nr:salicylate hydroxylase [Pseudohyphozyma bogoriensis]